MPSPFWNKKWGKDQICAITNARLRPGKNKNKPSPIITLECGHRFYRKAFYQWVITSKKTKCPCCRQIVNID